MSTRPTFATPPAEPVHPSKLARFFSENEVKLCHLDPGTKVPSYLRWNERPEKGQPGGWLDTPEEAEAYYRRCPRDGMGMVHSGSGTLAWDEDNPDWTRLALAAVCIDPNRIYDAGAKLQGNPEKRKAFFRNPDSKDRPTVKVEWPHPDGPDENRKPRSVTIFELRGGACQDVIHGVHPDTGEPYAWLRAPWELGGWPDPPPEFLLLRDNWEALLPKLRAACPWAVDEEAPKQGGSAGFKASGNGRPTPGEWDDVRAEILRRIDLDAVLERIGAVRVKGNSWLCPFHSDRSPSFWTFAGGDGVRRWVCAHGDAPVGAVSGKGKAFGDAIDIVAHKRGCALGEATARLARELEIGMPGGRFETGAGNRRRGSDGPSVASVVTDSDIRAAPWPEPLLEEAFHGLAGDIVRTLEPHSEADPAALLAQILIGFGNAVGRGPHFVAEADRHYTNLFGVLVGLTAKGRKGSSWGQARRLIGDADPLWVGSRVEFGLSSGEGLIWAVRDPIVQRQAIKKNGRVAGYEDVVTDPGVTDKRLLVIEQEFASALRVLGRDGNTLSAVIRCAWDTGELRKMTKNSPARATGAHISAVGHITKPELLRYLDSTEAGNGFANRFLWWCVRRSKPLPEGGEFPAAAAAELSERLAAALKFARGVGLMHRDPAARAIWHGVYAELSEGRPGLMGAMVARAEAQVMRLAMIYALLDQCKVIDADHLLAALAVWDYCEASARFIFGGSLGDPMADELLKVLRRSELGMTRTEIRDYFARNATAGKLARALEALAELGLARREMVPTDGRPAERWFAESGVTTETTKGPAAGGFCRFGRFGRSDFEAKTAGTGGHEPAPDPPPAETPPEPETDPEPPAPDAPPAGTGAPPDCQTLRESLLGRARLLGFPAVEITLEGRRYAVAGEEAWHGACFHPSATFEDLRRLDEALSAFGVTQRTEARR
jgi:hypothetical protein